MQNEAFGHKAEVVDTVVKAGKAGIATWQLQVIGVLFLSLVVTGAFATRYFVTRQPIQSSLPAFPDLTFSTPPRYQFSIFGVEGPLGVAVNPDGDRIYVAEGTGEREIVTFDRTGQIVVRFAPPDSDPATRAPVYIAASADKVYVTDRMRHTLDIYDRDGNYLGAVTPPDNASIWSPLGVGLDKDGNILVTDVTKNEHRLFVLDPEGNKIMSVGSEGKEKGQFSFPNGVVADKKSLIYVGDGNNGRIQVFDYAGNLVDVIGGGLGLPRGLAIDHEQRLYMVDTTGHTVSVYDVKDKPETLYNFGAPGTEDGQLNFPNGIAVDGAGRVYVADRVNQRVQVWLY